MDILIKGPQGCGKTKLTESAIIPFLREPTTIVVRVDDSYQKHAADNLAKMLKHHNVDVVVFESEYLSHDNFLSTAGLAVKIYRGTNPNVIAIYETQLRLWT